MVELNEQNYYSIDMDREYCSASQLKQFKQCEARTVATLNGEWQDEKSDALIFGSLVDALWENDGNLEEYSKDHPELFSSRGATKGQLLAKFQKAVDCYERTKRDPLFAQFMSGDHQSIFVGEIGGEYASCSIARAKKMGEEWDNLEISITVKPKKNTDKICECITFYNGEVVDKQRKIISENEDFFEVSDNEYVVFYEPVIDVPKNGKSYYNFSGGKDGMKFKAKLDSYHKGKCIVDLKTTKSIRQPFYVADTGHVSFVEKFDYFMQLAIYQELVYQNTGEKLPCFIAAVSKEDEPDIELIFIDNDKLKEALQEVKQMIPSIGMLKSGEVEPIRCECCAYCKATKVLKKPVHYSELILDGTN